MASSDKHLCLAALLASALTQPAEVVALATAAILVRSLAIGFLCLTRGGSRAAVAEEVQVAAVASLPFGALVAIALTVYLVLNP